ncbi:MAG: 3-phosphoshikimate 1-carboxyvinyltransferase, partial [Pyrinomonadaceae bacterium]
MRIQPARRLRGRLRLPGDKSISHRAAIIAALAAPGGHTRITNFASSADCASTLACLRGLGVVVRREGDEVRVEGAGRGDGMRAPALPLDCGNSGSTIRMLAGVLAGRPFTSTLTGDDSLRSRPMRRIIEPLEMMGARVNSEGGRAPLRVEGRAPLSAIRYEMPVASAQVKSAVLLAGLAARGHTEVVERAGATRDHTERMLRWFGAPVEIRPETGHKWSGTQSGSGVESNVGDVRRVESHVVSVEGGAEFGARDFDVPGDISSAAFLIAAATLMPGSELEIRGVGLNPTRAEIVRTMQTLGAEVEAASAREQCNEEVGDLRIRGAAGGRLVPVGREGEGSAAGSANMLRGAAVARLIDELPALAVVGTRVEGGLEIRDAA